MNRSDAATLLAVAASFDRRTVGKADAAAWAVILADVSFEEAQAAVVAHYAERSEWLMPSHIIALIKDRRGLPPARTWCGACDQRTRLLEDPETRKPYGRCPDCHPLSKKASTP
jgi:hypothetical protein